jgi:hypothetical protein
MVALDLRDHLERSERVVRANPDNPSEMDTYANLLHKLDARTEP